MSRRQGLFKHSLRCEPDRNHIPTIIARLFQVQIQGGHGIVAVVCPEDLQQFLSTQVCLPLRRAEIGVSLDPAPVGLPQIIRALELGAADPGNQRPVVVIVLHGPKTKLLEGEREALRAVPRRALLFLVVGGATLYGFVGVLCMLLGGNFLDYSVLMDDPVTARQVGIIAIELGVGMAVCGALLSIFHAFAAREPR